MCISAASSEIDDEDAIIFEARKVLNGTQRLCSVYSKEGTKGPNQDSASLQECYGMEDGAFCGVYDGHGKNGHKVSKIVNNRLSSIILDQKNAFERIDAIENGNDNTPKNHDDTVKDHLAAKNLKKWKEAIVSAFKVMDKELKLQQNLDCSYSGTTAVVVIKQGEGIVIANLGDSRAVLGTIYDGKNLIAIPLTTDLKPGLPREAERIRRCNGCVYASKEEAHAQRVWIPNDENSPGLAMSRAFGDFLLKDYGVIAIPEISYHSLTASDQFIVLASDGVWDVLSNKEVASIVWNVDTEEAAARAVVEAANAAWRQRHPSYMVDDCTVVCLFLHEKSQLQSY